MRRGVLQVAVSLKDARGEPSGRRWLEANYRDYLDDLAPDGTGHFPVLGEVGHTGSDQVARWFADRSAEVLLIHSDGRPAGFAIVARGPARRGVPGAQTVDYRMAEFFVARPHRRRGIGFAAVPLILDRFAGRWEIQESVRNAAAVGFWRRTVARYTGGRYQERVADGEVRQVFVSGRPDLRAAVAVPKASR